MTCNLKTEAINHCFWISLFIQTLMARNIYVVKSYIFDIENGYLMRAYKLEKNTYCPTSNKNNNNRDEKMVTNTFDNEIDDALRSK